MNKYINNDEDMGVCHSYSSYDDRILKIRTVYKTLKENICACCKNNILPGSKATYYSGVSARKFYTYYICDKC